MTIISTSAYAKHLVPVDELLDFVSSLLKEAPRTMRELETLTGYSHRPLKKHLAVLIEDGHAHMQRISSYPGYKNVYHSGPGFGVVPVLRVGETPRQRITGSYPAHNRRDPLVSALFGAPGARP